MITFWRIPLKSEPKNKVTLFVCIFEGGKRAEKRLLGTIRVVMVFTRKVFYFGALIAPSHSLFYRTSRSLRSASQTRHKLLTTETVAKLRHECDKSSNSSSAITIALRVSMIYIVTYAVSTMYVHICVFCKSGLARIVYTIRELKRRKISICGRYAVTELLNRTVLAVSLTL